MAGLQVRKPPSCLCEKPEVSDSQSWAIFPQGSSSNVCNHLGHHKLGVGKREDRHLVDRGQGAAKQPAEHKIASSARAAQPECRGHRGGGALLYRKAPPLASGTDSAAWLPGGQRSPGCSTLSSTGKPTRLKVRSISEHALRLLRLFLGSRWRLAWSLGKWKGSLPKFKDFTDTKHF